MYCREFPAGVILDSFGHTVKWQNWLLYSDLGDVLSLMRGTASHLLTGSFCDPFSTGSSARLIASSIRICKPSFRASAASDSAKDLRASPTYRSISGRS